MRLKKGLKSTFIQRKLSKVRMGGIMKEETKRIYLNNLGIKISSVFFALLIWMIIINIDDPYKTRTFSVNVETINESALQSVNKVYEVIDGSTANVKVRGKKSVVDKLEASDIRATADLSDLSAVNAVAIEPSLTINVSSEVTLECNQVLKVSLEDRASKQVKVTVVTEGNPQKGYSIGECVAKPNMIEVSGGESAIRQIDSVRVYLNVNNVSDDFSKKLVPAAYDSDGNKVTSSTLTFSSDSIKVTASVLETKKIPVKVKIIGEPAEGYQYVKTNCLPKEVEIAGRPKVLSHVNSVPITLDISGMNSDSRRLEQDILISDYLPENITVLDESATVSIKIVIEQLYKKKIQIAASDIAYSGLGDEYEVIPASDLSKVYVVVTGIASDLRTLNTKTISPYINCKGLEEGTYSMRLRCDVGEDCEVIKYPKIKIIIKKKKSDKTESTPEPSATKKPADSDEVTHTPEPTSDSEDKDDADKDDGDTKDTDE